MGPTPRRPLAWWLPQMAFVMANMGQVRASQLVMDPFAGTGSILVSLVYFGAHVIGMDMDVRVIRDGADRGGQHRDIWSNFQQYGLAAPVGLFCGEKGGSTSALGGPRQPLTAPTAHPPQTTSAGGACAGTRSSCWTPWCATPPTECARAAARATPRPS